LYLRNDINEIFNGIYFEFSKKKVPG